mgnify:CR=1 FL=1
MVQYRALDTAQLSHKIYLHIHIIELDFIIYIDLYNMDSSDSEDETTLQDIRAEQIHINAQIQNLLRRQQETTRIKQIERALITTYGKKKWRSIDADIQKHLIEGKLHKLTLQDILLDRTIALDTFHNFCNQLPHNIDTHKVKIMRKLGDNNYRVQSTDDIGKVFVAHATSLYPCHKIR